MARWVRCGPSVDGPFVGRKPHHASVSTSRSSNRTCGLSASGSRRKCHDVAHGRVRVRWVRQTRPSTSCRVVSEYRTIPLASAFPETGAGRLLHHCFRGLLSVHLSYGLNARQVAFATLCTRGFSSLVASTAALIATGWSEPVPGRVYLPLWTTPLTAHPVSSLIATSRI